MGKRFKGIIRFNHTMPDEDGQPIRAQTNVVVGELLEHGWVQFGNGSEEVIVPQHEVFDILLIEDE